MIAARDEANAEPPMGILMDEGDMVVFDPMCLHSCVLSPPAFLLFTRRARGRVILKVPLIY